MRSRMACMPTTMSSWLMALQRLQAPGERRLGISLSSSPDCVIERNLIFGNREGFNFREQHRTTPRIGDPKERAVWNHNEEIRRNIIACNRDAQVWGWFDLKDGRQWPAEEGRGRSNSAESIAARHDDLAAAYVASNAQRQ